MPLVSLSAKVLNFVVLAERALENFRQMSARLYDKRRTLLIA
jgi:hypothetical protein